MGRFAYYNEIDPYAAQWLRNLMDRNLISPGEVDERSIADVRPADILAFAQCHFFAGIGVWSHALRRSGWPDHRPVWTGSCPCQPFSAAGRGEGFDDERHLWPAFEHLIAQCRPPVVFGEQVASKAVDPWIDLVQDDMEGLGYAFGAVPFPSAGVGAPHIRDRAYFVAHAAGLGSPTGAREPGAFLGARKPQRSIGADLVDDSLGAGLEGQRRGHQAALRHGEGSVRPVAEAGQFGGVADAALGGRGEERPHAGGSTLGDRAEGNAAGSVHGGSVGGMADAEGLRHSQRGLRDSQGPAGQAEGQNGGGRATLVGLHGSDGAGRDSGFGHNGGPELDRPGPTNGLWRDPDWLFCRDGRWRPVEPGTFPLAHGAPARVGRLRAYGNAINAEAAIAFISSAMECLP